MPFCDKSMPDKDAMLLSPWQKWLKYRRPPWKFLVTLLIPIVATIQVLYLSSTFADYDRNTREVLTRTFLIDDCKDGIHTDTALRNCIAVATLGFHSLLNGSIGHFDYKPDEKVPTLLVRTIKSPVLYKKSLDDWKFKIKSYSEEMYQLTVDQPAGPLSPAYYTNHTGEARVAELIAQLVSVTFEAHILSGELDDDGSIVFLWTMQLKFESPSSDGLFKPVLTAHRSIRSYKGDALAASTEILLDASLMFLTSLSTVLTLKSLYRQFGIFWRRRQALSSANLSLVSRAMRWQDLPWRIKLQFFNMWTLVTLGGNTMLFISSFLNLAGRNSVEATFSNETSRVLLGAGTFCAWADTVKYLGYNHQFYLLILTLRNSLPSVTRFLISLMPLFFGYALCGTIMFSAHSGRFATLSDSCVTLFALLNGDEIRSTFVELEPSPYPVIAQLYCYTFVSLFICCCLNMTIFLIEDAYHLAKGLHVEDNTDYDQHGEEFRVWENILEDHTSARVGDEVAPPNMYRGGNSVQTVGLSTPLLPGGTLQTPSRRASGQARSPSSRSGHPSSPAHAVTTLEAVFEAFDEVKGPDVPPALADPANIAAGDGLPDPIHEQLMQRQRELENLLSVRQLELRGMIMEHMSETSKMLLQQVDEFHAQIRAKGKESMNDAAATTTNDHDDAAEISTP